MDVLIMDLGGNIPGECNLTDYTKKIEILSFSHGVAMQITGDVSNTVRTSGKPNHQDFTVTKYMDAASPLLNQACCKGDNLPQVKLIVARNDSGKVLPFMTYTLKNVVISSVSIGGGSGDKPVETVTLNYAQIDWVYTSQKQELGDGGQVNGKWDLAKNAAA
ncbi:MAG TPA: type VI secretion system tube protein Hcp [Blastocatellia bacterium]|nr:type VI secretion system tube protein Hcp [Blastocatellia bacterium]